ncbi:MAG: preprotein translocase subunit SecG [Phycisphaera sp.]|nr:preprotein translocase subunit SecG [Phycisphaera sp.]
MARMSPETVKSMTIMIAVFVALSAVIFLIPWPTLIAIIFTLVSVLLMLVILIQKPRGGGLAGAFGGAGAGAQAAFGAKTGDVLTGVTVLFFGLFLVTAIRMTWATNPKAPEPPAKITAPEGSPTQTDKTTDTTKPASTDLTTNPAADLNTPAPGSAPGSVPVTESHKAGDGIAGPTPAPENEPTPSTSTPPETPAPTTENQ